jgi:hypothetical protein
LEKYIVFAPFVEASSVCSAIRSVGAERLAMLCLLPWKARFATTFYGAQKEGCSGGAGLFGYFCGTLFKNLGFACSIGKKLSVVLCPKEKTKFFFFQAKHDQLCYAKLTGEAQISI